MWVLSKNPWAFRKIPWHFIRDPRFNQLLAIYTNLSGGYYMVMIKIYKTERNCCIWMQEKFLNAKHAKFTMYSMFFSFWFKSDHVLNMYYNSFAWIWMHFKKAKTSKSEMQLSIKIFYWLLYFFLYEENSL